MEFFRFCLEIIRREAKKFNVGIQTSTATQLTAANVDDFSYDNAHNRCAFLYKCGTINLAFAKDCFSKFLSECNGIDYLLAKWRLESYLTFCSISKGPALDYVALLLSDERCRILASLIGNIRVITKYGAWRNTANIMLEIINEGYFNNLPPSIGNIEVTQGDPFNNFNDKVRLPINDSDVVVMIKALNLQSDGYDQAKISKTIQEFLEALKSGAVLFCIDTKPSIKEITQILATFAGKYLLEPTNMSTKINFEYTDLYKGHFGCLPVTSGRGCFLVWEKSAVSTSSMKYKLKELSESVEYKVSVTDKKYDNAMTNTEYFREASLSIGSSNYDQKLLKHFNDSSTPKSSEKNRTANTTLDIRSNDFQLTDNVNNFFQNSNYPLQSNSLINRSISDSNLTKKENLMGSLDSLKFQLDSISNNICMQTGPEFSKEVEVSKIAELTDKITDLTVELTKLLENNTLHQCLSDNCSRNSEEMCKSGIEVCCSCSCKRISQCSQKLRTCCQKCIYDQSYSCSNHNSDNAFMHDGVSDNCRLSTYPTSNFLPGNASSTAQLVIPLSNLSADVIHQIISLITPSNHEN